MRKVHNDVKITNRFARKHMMLNKLEDRTNQKLKLSYKDHIATGI